eukprot:9766250-Alexandrium_andersonii.AAC.1
MVGLEGAPKAQNRSPIRNPPIRNLRNPWLCAHASPVSARRMLRGWHVATAQEGQHLSLVVR